MVKSRLSVELGSVNAAKIYQILLEHTLLRLSKGKFAVALHCYPDNDHSFFAYCRNKYNVSLHNQVGNDLGHRMFQAMHDYLKTDHQVILIGTDCLELDLQYIKKAFTALEAGNDVTLGPALDGGYALIGATEICESLFTKIPWGTDKVLRKTEDRIKRLGWNYTSLPMVRDMDTYTDYQYFSEHKKFRYLFSQFNHRYISTS